MVSARGELERVEFWEFLLEVDFVIWGRGVGEVGAFSEVGAMETPPPFDEADFMAWASFHLLCVSIF